MLCPMGCRFIAVLFFHMGFFASTFVLSYHVLSYDLIRFKGATEKVRNPLRPTGELNEPLAWSEFRQYAIKATFAIIYMFQIKSKEAQM